MHGKMFHNSYYFLTAKLHNYFDTKVKNLASKEIIFPSRGKCIYITMEFKLHRDENSSTSRGNFEVVYRPKIDGIPLFQLHPIVKRFMIGYK